MSFLLGHQIYAVTDVSIEPTQADSEAGVPRSRAQQEELGGPCALSSRGGQDACVRCAMQVPRALAARLLPVEAEAGVQEEQAQAAFIHSDTKH